MLVHEVALLRWELEFPFTLYRSCLIKFWCKVLAQARASLKDPSRPYTPASLDNRTNLDFQGESTPFHGGQSATGSTINSRMDHLTNTLVKKKSSAISPVINSFGIWFIFKCDFLFDDLFSFCSWIREFSSDGIHYGKQESENIFQESWLESQWQRSSKFRDKICSFY